MARSDSGNMTVDDEDSRSKGDNSSGASGEKYSLRPRSSTRRCAKEPTTPVAAPVEPPAPVKKVPKPPRPSPLGEPKGKDRRKWKGGAPMSRYRRKTANARERDRMKEINDAFDALRRAIPCFPPVQTSGGLTKITTLRLAINYIKALGELLEQDSSQDSGQEPESEPKSPLQSANPVPPLVSEIPLNTLSVSLIRLPSDSVQRRKPHVRQQSVTTSSIYPVTIRGSGVVQSSFLSLSSPSTSVLPDSPLHLPSPSPPSSPASHPVPLSPCPLPPSPPMDSKPLPSVDTILKRSLLPSRLEDDVESNCSTPSVDLFSEEEFSLESLDGLDAILHHVLNKPGSSHDSSQQEDLSNRHTCSCP